MALVIETGAGVPGAESYAAATDLLTYCTNYGFIAPATTPAQEAFLRRAARNMEIMHWAGQKTAETDALQWPRQNAYRRDQDPNANGATPLASNVIPPEIFNGQMQLALELYLIETSPTFDPGASGRLTSITNEVTGAVRQSKTYDNSGRSTPPSPHEKSDTWFWPWTTIGNFSAMASRA